MDTDKVIHLEVCVHRVHQFDGERLALLDYGRARQEPPLGGMLLIQGDRSD